MNMSDAQQASAAPRTDPAWLEAHWMPFTGNRDFKAHPRLITAAQGAYYTYGDGRQLFDGLSGLWCSGLGHGRTEIVEAIARQAATLDYSPAFQFGHPLSFELANRIVASNCSVYLPWLSALLTSLAVMSTIWIMRS